MEWNMEQNMEWNMERTHWLCSQCTIKLLHKHYRSAKCHKAPNKETVTVQQCVQAVDILFPIQLIIIALGCLQPDTYLCGLTVIKICNNYMYM